MQKANISFNKAIKNIGMSILKVLLIQFIIYGVLYFPVAYFYDFSNIEMFNQSIDMLKAIYLVYILLFFFGCLFYIIIRRIKILTVSKWCLLVFGSVNQYILYNIVKHNFKSFKFENVAVEMFASNIPMESIGYFNWLNPLHINRVIIHYLFFTFIVFTLCYFADTVIKKYFSKVLKINK